MLCGIASQRTGIFIFMTLGTSNVAFSLKLICALKWLMCCSCIILCRCCFEISSEFLTMDGAFGSPCKVVVCVDYGGMFSLNCRGQPVLTFVQTQYKVDVVMYA